MKKALSILTLAAASNLYAQDDNNCGPKLVPMTTTRVPFFNDEGEESGYMITVSEADTETRTMIAAYETPYSDSIGAFTMDGDITFTNKSPVTRRQRFRQSILLSEGIMPIIPPAFSEVCWEPDIRRLITYYEQVVQPGETIRVPIFWEITTRLEAQLADVNADGVVDAADQGLLMAAFGTDNPLYDLDQSGVVDSADLGILLSQWSETSDDVIEDANAGDPDPIEQIWNPAWETSDYIISVDIESEPIRGGNGQVRIPFPDWQWTA